MIRISLLLACAITFTTLPQCFAQPSLDPHWVLSRPFDFSAMYNLSEVQAGWDINQSGYTHSGIDVFNPANTTLLPGTGVQIITRKQEYQNEHYTSGGLSLKCSSPEFGVKFGYMEVYARITQTYGFWPAFWLWTEKPLCDGIPVSICDNCPGNGQTLPCPPSTTASCDYEEIDVFEMIPGVVEGNASVAHYGQVHTRFVGTNNVHETYNDAGQNYFTYSINDYTNYHIYGLEWTPEHITFFVDNIAVRAVPNVTITQNTRIILEQGLSGYVNDIPYERTSPNYSAKFDVPASMSQYNFSSINTTPAIMDIAYVNIYNLNHPPCPLTEIYTQSNMNTAAWNSYIYSVKNQIVIGPGTGSVPVATTKYLRATDSITINGSFTVPVGATLTLDVTDCF